jgi:hypothetical protein
MYKYYISDSKKYVFIQHPHIQLWPSRGAARLLRPENRRQTADRGQDKFIRLEFDKKYADNWQKLSRI